jgi:hypothetical protein
MEHMGISKCCIFSLYPVADVNFDILNSVLEVQIDQWGWVWMGHYLQISGDEQMTIDQATWGLAHSQMDIRYHC